MSSGQVNGATDTLTIWFDESGFTGEDLVNPDQRYFTLASTIVGDAEAEAILRTCFPRHAGAEFKFSNLWRGTRHRAGLLRFSEMLTRHPDRSFVYVIDKRFSLLIKLVDYLIEPLMWRSGRDFYRDAYSRKFVNTVHADLLGHGTEALYDETIIHWNRLARTPTLDNLEALQRFLRLTANELNPPLSTFYDLAALGAEEFLDPGERVEDFHSSNDLQVTAMLSSVSYWRSRRLERFAIVHDESSSFAKRRAMWDALIRGDVEPFEAEGAGGRIAFPLCIDSSQAARSEESFAIQFCDILAGMFARACRVLTGERDPFLVELMKSGLGDMAFEGVMPEPERVNGPPPTRSGPDLLDRMVGVMRPALPGSRPTPKEAP